MKILWFKWKDIDSEYAGGAEFVDDYLIKYLAHDGHKVTIITSNSKHPSKKPLNKNIKIYRAGNFYTIYFLAFFVYRKYCKSNYDLVIDEMNTLHFFTKLFIRSKRVVLCYQLAKKVWFYQIFFPINIFGYLLECLYLRIIKNSYIITESESTKNDLIKNGFSSEKISIFNIGINLKNLKFNKKYNFAEPIFLSLGSIRPMKRTLHQIKAFELICNRFASAKLFIAGDSSSRYGKYVLNYISHSKFKDNIFYLNFVDIKTRDQLFADANFIFQTSIKEGWGLVVTEANNFRTPTIAYNCDGIRDSIINGKTGILTELNNPSYLASAFFKIWKNESKYRELSDNAFQNSLTFSIENSYSEFYKCLKKI